MSSETKRVPVAGSERAPVAGAHAVGAADPAERVLVTVRVRPRQAGQMKAGQMKAAIAEAATALPGQRRQLSREEFEQSHGSDPGELARVEEFAHEHDLDVVEVSSPRRSVVLSGTVAALSVAFGVELRTYEHPGGSYRGRVGAVHVPEALAGIIEGVFGLDDRAQAQPHFQRAGLQAHAGGGSFTPPELARLYNFPPPPAGSLAGSGQCIAIIELGGGYRTQDLRKYFGQLGVPKPGVAAISVDRAHNTPSTPDSADGEVLLDIEVAGAVAPGARLAVYFAPNTDQGFLDAITTAIHDSHRKPSVISISWGSAESQWTEQAKKSFDEAFQAAAALGITVCAASGDNGSSDGLAGGRAHVDFPASSPFVLGCGGTRLAAAGAAISAETAWNDGPRSATGGGVSDTFDKPAWQAQANVPPSANAGGRVGRGVPDVCGNADPQTGYAVRVDGVDQVIGGTSAVAPLWAGLIAVLNQHLGQPVGYLNPLLYTRFSNGVLRDITQGSNGAYHAGAGWDACTGLGSPDGAKLLQALKGSSP